MKSHSLHQTVTVLFRICSELVHGADSINIDTVVFLTDVDGIFDCPPSKINCKLISKIFVDQDGSIAMPQTDNLSHDVTGGIQAKIQV